MLRPALADPGQPLDGTGVHVGRGEWADSDRLAPLGTHETYRGTGADIPAAIEAARLQSGM